MKSQELFLRQLSRPETSDIKKITINIICSECGSSEFSGACEHEYYTAGSDMEHVEWKHVCLKCGYVESVIRQACYGYSNHYACPFPNCTRTFLS